MKGRIEKCWELSNVGYLNRYIDLLHEFVMYNIFSKGCIDHIRRNNVSKRETVYRSLHVQIIHVYIYRVKYRHPGNWIKMINIRISNISHVCININRNNSSFDVM